MMIRMLRAEESRFLADKLYEAIFIPEGQAALPRDIIHHPSLSKYIDRWGSDPYDLALVAEEKGQLVGAIWGRRFTIDQPGFGYVDDHTPEVSMAVRSDKRDQGIGTALLQALETAYQEGGVANLSLSVDQANPAAKLYQRLGYEMVGETETAWTMRKSLI